MSGGGVYGAAGFAALARRGAWAAGFFAAVFRAVVFVLGFDTVCFFTAFFAVFFMGRTLQARRNVVNGSMRRATLAVLLLACAAAPAAAQALDPASEEALAAVLRLLQDPAQRGPAVAGDPRAAAIDREVQTLAGSPELAQAFYELAAEVFADLTRGTGGDARRLGEALERAKADPEAFTALLSPATLDRLRALAVRISDRRR
ncbi:MAG: hypothetical protein A3E31_16620 [Candidatus Rokubacteria bacterium RIFCSPHIGHO2_12_FULL_73_22]|nr:MAG: hypothetical protein A3D33_07530 [Candidatus Rokubacteria bacterium RIFCSPHIGHO2_02_FULL_73_26]OGK98810.1 MAG: hypothetical protein A3E31_16620 [Candidatus Rokubacteria bacterium RIFCSPHIGHO2_12_FULL_73_22]OGL13282.1 MAG: hypothetical protein A3I14_00155 [Candidatus Rokubacteria bacterium RIFCSPLOWO2_02_FULL_73_56]OGL24970.1 MAG: hypothetical protein A3G44_02180 [Candidatus Rokubacteria bacterium RIFCSPLOWO2_12_FULL_73_47]